MNRTSISKRINDIVRNEAGFRCGYCRAPQRLVLGQLEVEHIVPVAAGGLDDRSNLWLACSLCNRFKSATTQHTDDQSGEIAALFNPRRPKWLEHFRWSEDGVCIVGLTACGRATVNALQLNHPIAIAVRREWVTAGWHPPDI
jgi:hypothetical protein